MTAKKQPIVVYGGSGFLGSHIADALSAAGRPVRIFDHKPSPYLAPGQEMIVGDITDADAVARAAEGCEFAYHFAAIADIDEANDRPMDVARLNILGTLTVLEAARAQGVKRVLFASTVYVYSGAGSFYRVSKLACEHFIEAYRDRYGLPYTILRYGSLYGPRSDARNSIYRMCRQALTEGKITYKGAPDAHREYIHVHDAAKLSVQAQGAEYENRALVLTGQERLRVADLMQMIAEMLPREVALEYGASDPKTHYVMTPYSYNPRLGHKVTLNDYVDLGQGILDMLGEIDDRPGKSGS